MKPTYICSPCRGDYESNIEKAKIYCRKAILEGLLPIAPHVYFTQFIDDTQPEERKLGLACGIHLLKYCQLIRVYGDHVSSGMKDEIRIAGLLEIEIEIDGSEEFAANVMKIYSDGKNTPDHERTILFNSLFPDFRSLRPRLKAKKSEANKEITPAQQHKPELVKIIEDDLRKRIEKNAGLPFSPTLSQEWSAPYRPSPNGALFPHPRPVMAKPENMSSAPPEVPTVLLSESIVARGTHYNLEELKKINASLAKNISEEISTGTLCEILDACFDNLKQKKGGATDGI